MQLSANDLKQLQPNTISSLKRKQLEVLASKLLSDVKELHDRLNQTSENSSRPPSSTPPWMGMSSAQQDGLEEEEDDAGAEANPKEDKAEEDEATSQDEDGKDVDPDPLNKKDDNNKKEGKPGQREGASGHGRTVALAVTHEQTYSPEYCAICGDSFSENAPFRAYTARYEVEVVTPASGTGIEISHIKHTYGERRCDCGHWSRAAPGRCASENGWQVELTEWHIAGPMLVALICSLSLRMRMSRARIQEFLHDWLGVYFCVATINQCIHEAGRAVEPTVENEILAAVRDSELLHADETGWTEKGHPLWLWVFTCKFATLFVVGRRTKELVESVLGNIFNGWLVCDGYCAYRHYDWRLRCLAHLIRKAKGLNESLDQDANRFGRRTLDVLEALMDAVYQAREGPPDKPLSVLHAIRLGKFWAFCENHRDSEHKKTRELAREFINDWNAIWAVLDYPWLPLTNNEAERALRHWVIARRISYGTRTAQGTYVFSLLASVIDTCRQRDASPWLYIAGVVAQRRKGQDAPPLPLPAS
jgi:hypothetical protein